MRTFSAFRNVLCAALVLAAPAAAAEPPSPDALHRRARASERDDPAGARQLHAQVLREHDGTVAAVRSAEALLDLLSAQVTAAASPEQAAVALRELAARIADVQASASYRLPEAAHLRSTASKLLDEIPWQHGELLVQVAHAGAPSGFLSCATYYAALVDRPGLDPARAATALFSAAQCFEAANMPVQAAQMYRTLLERHPQSEHAERSLAILAEISEKLASFDDAARYMELYAARYGERAQAPELLRSAYLLRVGLGQKDRAVTDLARYVELYQHKQPELAAGAFWAKRELLDSDAERLRHAEEFLKMYGDVGGADRRVVAQATIGQLLWRQSCGKGLLHDACVGVRREAASRDRKVADRRAPGQAERCGAPRAGFVTVYERDPGLAERAQQHFAAVTQASQEPARLPGGDPARRQAYADAVAMAAVYAADRDYEAYLRLDAPGGLSFRVEEYKRDSLSAKDRRTYAEQVERREESTRRFLAYHREKTGLGQALQQRYDRVVAGRGSTLWTIAATARSAQIYQHYADQLATLEIPREFTARAQVDAYCEAVRKHADPARSVAMQRYEACLERSVHAGVFTDFTRLCEEELQRHDPARFPRLQELLGRPEYTESRPDAVGVQLAPDPPDELAPRGLSRGM